MYICSLYANKKRLSGKGNLMQRLKAQFRLQRYQLGYKREVEQHAPTFLGIPLVKSYQSLPVDPVTEEIIRIFKSKNPIFQTHYPCDIMGDGNCLYRSISVCLFGDPKWHIMIRVVIAHELVINHNDYWSMTEFQGVSVDYNNLIKEVLVKGQWGSESHIVAAGNAFGVSFNLIVSHPNYVGIEEIQKKGAFPQND